MPALQNTVAIVAGASSGIGHATALLFAREGAKVVVGARRQQELEQLVATIVAAGGQAVALAGDVAEESYAEALARLAVETYGGLDVAFNNAGMIAPMGPTPEISLADWRRTLDVNLTSAFLAAKYQLPAMVARGGGSLIFTASFVGYTVSFPGIATYSASKSGLIGLTQSLAVEFAERKVRVNALLPGATDTAMYREMNDTAESRNFITGLYPMRRIATPEEMAKSVLYLASDASTFTTGTAFMVEGGISINRT